MSEWAPNAELGILRSVASGWLSPCLPFVSGAAGVLARSTVAAPSSVLRTGCRSSVAIWSTGPPRPTAQLQAGATGYSRRLITFAPGAATLPRQISALCMRKLLLQYTDSCISCTL